MRLIRRRALVSIKYADGSPEQLQLRFVWAGFRPTSGQAGGA